MRVAPLTASAYRLSVFSRVLAASLGAYVLVNIISVAFIFLLPVAGYTAFLFGVQSNFLVYTIAIIWVFSVRTATKAWLGLLAVGLPLAVIDWYFYWLGATV